MANGFMGSKEEWDRLEAPPLELDPWLVSLSADYGFAIEKNGKNPQRSLIADSRIRYLLQIFTADEAVPTFNDWICASQRRDGRTWWREQFPLRAVTVDEIVQNEGLVRASAERLLAWTQQDLVPIGV